MPYWGPLHPHWVCGGLTADERYRGFGCQLVSSGQLQQFGLAAGTLQVCTRRAMDEACTELIKRSSSGSATVPDMLLSTLLRLVGVS